VAETYSFDHPAGILPPFSNPSFHGYVVTAAAAVEKVLGPNQPL